MAVAKYLFGDHISTLTIIILGVCYWIFNGVVNTLVGRFWELNDGWRIEAEVFGERSQPGRSVLVDTDGTAYGCEKQALLTAIYLRMNKDDIKRHYKKVIGGKRNEKT